MSRYSVLLGDKPAPTTEIPAPTTSEETSGNPSTVTEKNTVSAVHTASRIAVMPESHKAIHTALRQYGKPESPIAVHTTILNTRSMKESVQNALKSKASKKQDFRFPLELVEELNDIPYEVRKTYRKPLSKTAIFVAALTAYLWDYHQNAKTSLLYKHLIEE